MTRNFLLDPRDLFRIALAAVALVAADATASETRNIERYDPRIDRLLAPDTRLEHLAGGFQWLEGPAWNAREGHLLFSDIPANAIYRWREGRGVDLYLSPAGYTGPMPFAGREPGSNGLTFDGAGRLLISEHGDRRITRLEADGTRTVLAERFQGRRLNSPNDLIVHSSGDLYFTDPPFGLPRQFEDPARELDVSGVYRLTPAGEMSLLVSDLRAPNGIAFSPDERVLYLTDVDPARPAWLAYDVRPDGTVENGRVFADARKIAAHRPGGPDGLEIDADGNLFAAGPGGVYVFAPDATLLGFVETGVATANLEWGGDGSVLYVTADTALYRLRTSTRGARFAREGESSTLAPQPS